MSQQPTELNVVRDLYRFIDKKQPEVKWAAVMSFFMESFLVVFSLHANFTIYEADICGIIQCIIAGHISFIGLAIAGIAIVIALFTADQIKEINKLKEGAFDHLLYDFKWFALVSAIATVIFIAVIFVIRSPYPIAPTWLFYILETKKPEKSRQKAAGCRNTQEVIYTQPLFITPFYLLKGYRSDRLDINIPVIPKAARRDGFTR